MEAFRLLCRTEGIIPAIESAHALAGALDLGKELGPDGVVLVNLSGRGDKDVETAARWFGMLDEDARPRERRRRSRGRSSDRLGPHLAARPHRRRCAPRATRPSSGYLPVGFPDRRPARSPRPSRWSRHGVDVIELGIAVLRPRAWTAR